MKNSKLKDLVFPRTILSGLVLLALILPKELMAFALERQGEVSELTGIRFMPDPEGEVKWAAIQAGAFHGKFQPLPANKQPDWETNFYWLTFELENPTDNKQNVVLAFDRWDLVEVYAEEGDPDEYPKRTGLSIPYALRDYPYNSGLLIQLVLPPGTQRNFWIRLSKDRQLGLPPYRMGIQCGEAAAMDRRQETLAVIDRIVIALVLFALLYNLFFFIATGEKRYRFYLPLMLLVALESFRWAGFYGPWLGAWEHGPQLEWILLGAQNYLLCMGLMFLTRDILQTRKFNRRWDRRLLRTSVPVTAIYLTFLYDQYWGLILLFLAVILGLTLVARITWDSIRKKVPMSGYYMATVLVFGLLGGYHALGVNGWMPLSEIGETSLRSIAAVICDGVLSFALGRRFFGLTLDNERKQKEIIRHLEQRAERRAAGSREILARQEQVRKEVASQLQDDVQSDLASIRYRLLALKKDENEILDGAIHLLKEAMANMRSISSDLMPESLVDPQGLGNAVENLLLRVSEVMEVEFSCAGLRPLQEDIRLLAFRIVQELVTNTLKHANASRLEVQLEHRDNRLVILLRDDGDGFEAKGGKGKGMQNMAHNLKLYGGRMQIKSGLGKGTTVSVELPFEMKVEEVRS